METTTFQASTLKMIWEMHTKEKMGAVKIANYLSVKPHRITSIIREAEKQFKNTNQTKKRKPHATN